MPDLTPFCHALVARAGNRSLYQLCIHKVVLGAVLIASGAFSAAATAADVTDGMLAIEWTCQQQYDAYYHVKCMAQSKQATAALAVSMGVPAPSSVLGADMRAVALRGTQEVFAHGWSVPLYARPSDPQSVTQLLSSVLCDTAPQCTVNYGPGSAQD